jgi:BTB/POZ domain.
MFLNDFKEKNDRLVEINVPNCSYDIFLLVLQYMYTGDIDLSLHETTVQGASESMERILAILELADHLLLDHLKDDAKEPCCMPSISHPLSF